MPRGRNGTASSSSIENAIAPEVEAFVARLVGVVSALVRREVAYEIEAFFGNGKRRMTTAPNSEEQPRKAPGRKADARSFTCRAEGCTSSASPRFKFLCKEHRTDNVSDNTPATAPLNVTNNSFVTDNTPATSPEIESAVKVPALPVSEGEDNTGSTSTEPPTPPEEPEAQPEPEQVAAATNVEGSPDAVPAKEDEPSAEPIIETTEPAKAAGCSVDGCSYGWFRPSGGKRLCKAHWHEQRSVPSTDANPSNKTAT